MKNRIHIGISSIVLIFMILCLAVFSLLSLSDANTALSFSKRRAESLEGYYAADAAAQTFIRDYRKALTGEVDADPAYGVSQRSSQAAEDARSALPTGSSVSISTEGAVTCDIPLGDGQNLHVTLSPDGEDILTYSVYNSEAYTIDSRLPVLGSD